MFNNTPIHVNIFWISETGHSSNRYKHFRKTTPFVALSEDIINLNKFWKWNDTANKGEGSSKERHLFFDCTNFATKHNFSDSHLDEIHGFVPESPRLLFATTKRCRMGLQKQEIVARFCSSCSTIRFAWLQDLSPSKISVNIDSELSYWIRTKIKPMREIPYCSIEHPSLKKVTLLPSQCASRTHVLPIFVSFPNRWGRVVRTWLVCPLCRSAGKQPVRLLT